MCRFIKDSKRNQINSSVQDSSVLGVHRPKFLIVSASPGYKNLREWVQCLYKNLIDHLCVATSQTVNDRREQMLRVEASQVALIRVPIVH